ncbi:MAG: DUF6387 family protein [Methylococcaceae bacterium]
MTKELDTRWFDLKNYEALKAMSIEGWAWQLEARNHFHTIASGYSKLSDDDHNWMHETWLSIAPTIKAGIVPLDPNDVMDRYMWRADEIVNGNSFSTASVDSLTSCDLWSIAKDDDLSHVWDACLCVVADNYEGDHNNELSKIANTPIDFHIKKNFSSLADSLAHVAINLAATDEQIKNDFTHWLTHYRKAVDIQPQKKLFNQVDFDYWVKFGVVPYLDLTLIAKIEGKKITQNKLAQLIFPDEIDVDIVERLRKVTKPTAEMIIKSETYKTLSAQLVFENTTGMKRA